MIMNLQESIKKILKEETGFPLALRRYFSFEDIEDAFKSSLAENMGHFKMYRIFKSLKTFEKIVIDGMITNLEERYNIVNGESLYTNDLSDEEYHQNVRVPLIDYYSDRLKLAFRRVE